MSEMDRAQITAASFPFKLGKKTYRLSPLTDADIGELDNWLRARTIRMVTDSLDGQAPDIRRELMHEAIVTASSITWLSDEGLKMMGTLDGMAQLVWQMARGNHPDATPQDVRKELGDPANLDQARAAFRLLNVPRQEPGKKGARRKPRRRRRRRR